MESRKIDISDNFYIKVDWNYDEESYNDSGDGLFVNSLEDIKSSYIQRDVYFSFEDRELVYHMGNDIKKYPYYPTNINIRDGYWLPTNNYFNDWKHVSGEDISKVKEQYESVEQASLKYTLEDLNRHIAFLNEEWFMMVCSVTLYHKTAHTSFLSDGKTQTYFSISEISRSGLVQIESDTDASEKDSIEKDLISECIEKAIETINQAQRNISQLSDFDLDKLDKKD